MAQVDATALQPSPDLAGLLAGLSPAQAAAVARIAAAELAGQTIESLFDGPHKICSRSTYYRQRGWIHNTRFMAALALARREARDSNLDALVQDALAELKAATLPAARDLRRQIVGDEAAIDALVSVATMRGTEKNAPERVQAVRSIAAIGTPRATDALLRLIDLKDAADIRRDVIEALGVSAAGVNTQRRMADVAVLDRADKMTASKGLEDDLDFRAAVESLQQAERLLAVPAGAGSAATP